MLHAPSLLILIIIINTLLGIQSRLARYGTNSGEFNLKLDFSQLYVGFHYQLLTCHSIAYWRRIGELRATFAWMWLCVPWFFAQPASAASISPPVLVQDPQPPLPPDATLGFIGRDVPLRLVVEEDGSVSEVSLLKP